MEIARFYFEKNKSAQQLNSILRHEQQSDSKADQENTHHNVHDH